MNRRKFISQSSQWSLAAGWTAIHPGLAPLLPRKSANEKILVGLIGANSMGWGILSHALRQPNVECIGICDVDQNVLGRRTEEVAKQYGKKPQAFSDFRKLLELKDLDAVIIGTPDHWHCLIMVEACWAGKDVYVEKPMANSIAECTVMVRAARKYKRIVQVGQQQRSGKHWQEAMDFIHTGQIGSLRKVHAWANFNYGTGQPKAPDEPIPAGVDFDTWLGPAPSRSFNKTRFHGSWRMFWDYGGGLMTDWGAHLIDIALWAKKITSPSGYVMAGGGNFYSPDFAHETFDTQSVLYQFPDYTITWEHTAGIQSGPYNRPYGLAFLGNDATLVIDRGGWEIFPESEGGKFKTPAFPKRSGRESHEEHVRNWLECIRERKEPNCTVENGRLTAMYCHFGNIALRTHSLLDWNETSHSFGQNQSANRLIKPEYRKPWVFPEE
ncbi:MAG TPA: Gfo/Idh/MocA family oxidoreductase [Saprospiraceae bacterium]|nr:Gfo/Idh/MocA family oxidoreductase [Saprospiraceae bacterium]HNT20839.1 Gfo/Idh/MocA family oxidoreductase [Saprospiraceae bacterium]